jgi:hypothetical protein
VANIVAEFAGIFRCGFFAGVHKFVEAHPLALD